MVAGVGALFKIALTYPGIESIGGGQSTRRLSQLGIVFTSLLWASWLSASTLANPLQSTEIDPLASTHPTEVKTGIEDGTYFYGGSSLPDELGTPYMVFEANGNRLIGAMFMPYSSFDCFRGEVTERELSLQIINSYTQEQYDYEIAMVPGDAPVAVAGGIQLPVHLDGFWNLGEARDSERSILETCQAALAN